MIRSVVFDVNGVLQRIDQKEVLFGKDRLKARYARAFLLAITSEAHRTANTGKYRTKEETIQALIREHPGWENELRTVYSAGWENYFSIYPSMEKLVRELNGQYDLYILSNMSFAEKEHFIGYPLYSLFKGSVFSCDTGMIKPDPEIFRILLSSYDIVPEETLFIDDSQKNTEAAEKLGFQTMTVLPFGLSANKIRNKLKSK